MVLYTFCGISGSGKSTMAQTVQARLYLATGRLTEIISMDNWRKILTGDISNQTQNALAFKKAWAEMEAELRKGNNVIWDATNLKLSAINDLHKLVKNYNGDMVVYVLDADPDTCRSRVQADLDKGVDRSKTAEGDILKRQYENWLLVSKLLRDPKTKPEGLTVSFV